VSARGWSGVASGAEPPRLATDPQTSGPKSAYSAASSAPFTGGV
jgi:hypothetical protein